MKWLIRNLVPLTIFFLAVGFGIYSSYEESTRQARLKRVEVCVDDFCQTEFLNLDKNVAILKIKDSDTDIVYTVTSAP